MPAFPRPIAALSAQVNHFFKHRSERERLIFERARQLLTLPTIVRRRAAARALAGRASFVIDPEVGFVIHPPHVFPEAREIVEATRDLGRSVDLTRPGLSKKARSGFMVPLLDPAALDLQSPLVRLALRPDVVAAVTAYLGIVPVIAHLNVYYSTETAERARSSQLFHCDADATTQMKIFVLCSDVTLQHGPLTLLDARTSRALRKRLGYHFGRKIHDERLARLVNPSDYHPVIGPAGTVCFADTTQCFHFGSRVQREAGPRIVTMIQYLAPASFELPHDHRAGSPLRHLAASDTGLIERLVLGDA